MTSCVPQFNAGQRYTIVSSTVRTESERLPSYLIAESAHSDPRVRVVQLLLLCTAGNTNRADRLISPLSIPSAIRD